MKTEEKNKLIAEFMGLHYSESEECFVNAMGDYITKRLKYYFMWDWLMPVVEKILTKHHSQALFEHPEYVNSDDKYHFYFEMLSDCTCIQSGDGETMITATYKAVVKYIQWYNENNPKL